MHAGLRVRVTCFKCVIPKTLNEFDVVIFHEIDTRLITNRLIFE